MNRILSTLVLLSVVPSGYVAAKEASPGARPHTSARRDIEVTAKIRRSVEEDHSLSPDAHNVKILTRRGFVTLRGPVKTNIERMVVSEKAKDVAGDNNVKNELRVAK